MVLKWFNPGCGGEEYSVLRIVHNGIGSIVVMALAVAVSFAHPKPAHSAAAEGGPFEQRFNVTIRDQDLRTILDELAIAMGLPIKVSESVTGRYTASFKDASGRDLLDRMARERGLDWRYDGRRIVVTAKSEQTSRILSMDGVRLHDLSRALDILGVRAEQFPIRALDGEIAMIVAPPDYLATVEVVLGELIKRRQEAAALAEERMEERRARALARDALAVELRRLEAGRQIGAATVTEAPPIVIRNGSWGG